MDRRYINYSRKKFNNWRDRVKKHLPLFVTAFYSIERYIDYDTHKLLGRIILNINNPFYTIQSCDGKNIDRESEMCMEMLLEIDVNNLFNFITKNAKPNQPTIQ